MDQSLSEGDVHLHCQHVSELATCLTCLEIMSILTTVSHKHVCTPELSCADSVGKSLERDRRSGRSHSGLGLVHMLGAPAKKTLAEQSGPA